MFANILDILYCISYFMSHPKHKNLKIFYIYTDLSFVLLFLSSIRRKTIPIILWLPLSDTFWRPLQQNVRTSDVMQTNYHQISTGSITLIAKPGVCPQTEIRPVVKRSHSPQPLHINQLFPNYSDCWAAPLSSQQLHVFIFCCCWQHGRWWCEQLGKMKHIWTWEPDFPQQNPKSRDLSPLKEAAKACYLSLLSALQQSHGGHSVGTLPIWCTVLVGSAVTNKVAPTNNTGNWLMGESWYVVFVDANANFCYPLNRRTLNWRSVQYILWCREVGQVRGSNTNVCTYTQNTLKSFF